MRESRLKSPGLVRYFRRRLSQRRAQTNGLYVVISLAEYRVITHYVGPILLQYDENTQEITLLPEHGLPPHSDEDQVQLDVDRSFVYYPECKAALVFTSTFHC